ncbi:MAG: amidohydrolase family protein [Proteobacteria bacterium]|nr:amidohydrolase family protein [Pseudomonadota bacterium]HQR03641.1 amidohydrolase family protein [Rhodocyclaceae bacterium]
MTTFDLVIRGGTLLDGSGNPPVRADVGITGGSIAAVADGLARGREEIDATGHLVTPGFVDVHTHYDGQVTWENRLVPSAAHGVTTCVIGNCGVGFAPCRPEDRNTLVRLMEGVEDIPYPVLTQGLPWNWETFPDYLDVLAQRQYDMDIACYLPHAALRVYVMGERGANREPATTDDLQRMCALLDEALAAGALGIATSKTIFHRSSDGKPIPTLDSSDEELQALAGVLKKRNAGVFQIVEDIHQPGATLAHMISIARTAGRPLTFSIGTGNSPPYHWRRLLDELAEANRDGLTIKGQVLPRGIGMMLGHELTLNPFYSTATYRELSTLPFEERLRRLRDPETRTRILAEPVDPDPALVLGRMVRDFDHMFQLGDPPRYEQPWQDSIAGRAQTLGITPESLAYDLMLEGSRGQMLYLAMANYADGNLDAIGEIFRHPDVVPGLGDGGAHCATICDGSYSTFALMHWGRDRPAGKIPLPQLVHGLSRKTALLVGLNDRGLVAEGYKADLNIIDFERLHLHPPHLSHDLPAGGKRLIQHAQGYAATVVDGRVVYRNGQPTGELPGRLIRANRVRQAA